MYATLWRATAALAAAALAVGLVALATAPSDGATPTCRGQEATHVGERGSILNGTSGGDVMVSNGATQVNGRGGDDLFCVTGGGWPWVHAGGGDDVVDASQHTGPRVRSELGRGDDQYLGSPQVDYVQAGGGPPGSDRISTRGSRDVVLVYGSGDRTDVHLGRGPDRLRIYGRMTGFGIYGGRGRDWVNVRCECRRSMPFLDMDLRRGTYAISRGRGRLAGFEDTFVMGADRVSIVGTAVRNKIKVNGCRAEVRGRAGRDEIVHGRVGPWCAHPHMSFLGGGGDDVLGGGPEADRLYGGPGTDFADGRAGRDVCRAERRRSCER